MYIIGVAGQPSSGKDTVAEYLAKRGFESFSNSDMIRQEMTELGLPHDRPAMNRFATEQRTVHGAFWPDNLVCDRISGDAVISGFRNTAEVEYVRQRFPDHFKLLALSVPLETRYARARERNRMGDDISMEKFKEQEDIERSGNSAFHELDKVLALADVTIQNDSTLEQLFTQVDDFLKNIDKGLNN